MEVVGEEKEERRRRVLLTEPIVGVEAAREAADGVEHIEAERAAELGRQAQQEAGDAAEVGPDRRGRRRGGPDHQPPPEHRGQRRELLRRRRAPYPAPASAAQPPLLAVLLLLVVVVPGHGRRGHRGAEGSGTDTRRFAAYSCLALLRRDGNRGRGRRERSGRVEPRRARRGQSS